MENRNELIDELNEDIKHVVGITVLATTAGIVANQAVRRLYPLAVEFYRAHKATKNEES